MPGPQPATQPGGGTVTNLDYVAVNQVHGVLTGVPYLKDTDGSYLQYADPDVFNLTDKTAQLGLPASLDFWLLAYTVDLWNEVASNQAAPDVIPLAEAEGSGSYSIGTLA